MLLHTLDEVPIEKLLFAFGIKLPSIVPVNTTLASDAILLTDRLLPITLPVADKLPKAVKSLPDTLPLMLMLPMPVRLLADMLPSIVASPTKLKLPCDIKLPLRFNIDASTLPVTLT